MKNKNLEQFRREQTQTGIFSV